MNIEPAIPPLTLDTFEAMITPWLNNIKEERLTFVECHPSTGAYRRVRNITDGTFLPDQHKDFNNRFSIVQIDLRADGVESADELENLILRRSNERERISEQAKSLSEYSKHLFETKKKKITVFIVSGELIIYQNRASVLRSLANLRSASIATSVVFFECNLCSHDSVKFLSRIPNLSPRIYNIRLFEKNDVEQFMKYLRAKWSMAVHPELGRQISTQCGGSFLLIKSAYAHLKDNPKAVIDEIENDRTMQYNLMTIVENFNAEEREVLKGIASSNPGIYRNQEAFEYLVRVRFIKKQKNIWSITIPLLGRYLQNSYPQKKTVIVNTNGHIGLNGVPIDALFSKSERSLLIYLLEHRSVLISRDQLADLIWGKQSYEKYSDWAIDSHISRLRKRLMQLGYKKNVITTKKKQGVIFFTG